MSPPLLEVKNLETHFFTDDGISRAVDGISFSLSRGETLGMVGESGCGKSVSALSILRLIPEPPGRIVSGQILFDGKDLASLPERDMVKIRGNRISMIFQEPMTSLNPVYTIGDQIAEAFRIHRGYSGKKAREEALFMLNQVRIPDPEKRALQYPHELSGGMRQRVMIAMALACRPDILIADEPTTALDVTVQAQIMNLINELKSRYNAAILFISHNLGVISEISDWVMVMYAGMIVEYARSSDIFKRPLHPYTRGLLRALPRLEEGEKIKRLNAIKGSVPDPAHHPPGCRFHPRCPGAVPDCVANIPPLSGAMESHFVRCFRWKEDIFQTLERGAS
ncbi:ABC transporter ATP-binding protein [Candidatus Sumerlaeota bacterium]|nr:ABC transporter ATP-binding protein [Candidatus Sumerlaeota bacterium]